MFIKRSENLSEEAYKRLFRIKCLFSTMSRPLIDRIFYWLPCVHDCYHDHKDLIHFFNVSSRDWITGEVKGYNTMKQLSFMFDSNLDFLRENYREDDKSFRSLIRLYRKFTMEIWCTGIISTQKIYQRNMALFTYYPLHVVWHELFCVYTHAQTHTYTHTIQRRYT